MKFKVGDKVRIKDSATYANGFIGKFDVVISDNTSKAFGRKGQGWFKDATGSTWITLNTCNIKETDLELISKLSEVLQ